MNIGQQILRWSAAAGVVAAGSALTPVVHAADPADKAETEIASPWSGSAALGFVASGGNTSSRSQNAEYTLKYAGADWVFSSAGKLVQQRSDVTIEAADGSTREESQTTAENYRVDLRTERRVDAANYLFGQAAFVKDLFGAVRTSTSQTVGYGRRLIARDTTALDLEIGAGARQEEEQTSRETNSEAIGQLALRLDTRLGERASVKQLLRVESGSDNTVTDSQTRMRLSVIGSLWAQLGFDLRHNSQTGPNESSTDTITSISLLWEF
ncbi:MAG: DUF481 domain-containing protein [Oceanococcaceae bacterium]